MEYNFTQQVTKEDYVAFVNNHMKMSFLKPLNISLFIVSIGYLTISPFLMPVEERSYTFTFIGIGIVFLLFGMILFAKKNAGKQYDKASGQFKMSYMVNDEGLTYKVAEGNIEKKWFEFYSASETKEFLYVYVNKNSGMVIVKRDVNEQAVSFIKEQLSKNVKSKRINFLK